MTDKPLSEEFGISAADLAALTNLAATASNAVADGARHRERRAWAEFDAIIEKVKARRSIPSEEAVEGSRDEDIRECQAFSAGYEAAQDCDPTSVDPTSPGSDGVGS